MLFYTLGQAQVFLSTLYAGLAIGAWYDVNRLLRWMMQAGRWLTLLVDISFGVGCAAILLVTLVFANHGELRGYALLGGACGAVLYAGALGPLVRFLARGLIRLLTRMVKWLGRRKLVKRILK